MHANVYCIRPFKQRGRVYRTRRRVWRNPIARWTSNLPGINTHNVNTLFDVWESIIRSRVRYREGVHGLGWLSSLVGLNYYVAYRTVQEHREYF